jgi:hypothetical protein
MFQTILLYVVLVAGLFLILMSFIIGTKNIISGFTFKFIPFILGFGCILYFLLASGLLK